MQSTDSSGFKTFNPDLYEAVTAHLKASGRAAALGDEAKRVLDGSLNFQKSSSEYKKFYNTIRRKFFERGIVAQELIPYFSEIVSGVAAQGCGCNPECQAPFPYRPLPIPELPSLFHRNWALMRPVELPKLVFPSSDQAFKFASEESSSASSRIGSPAPDGDDRDMDTSEDLSFIPAAPDQLSEDQKKNLLILLSCTLNQIWPSRGPTPDLGTKYKSARIKLRHQASEIVNQGQTLEDFENKSEIRTILNKLGNRGYPIKNHDDVKFAAALIQTLIQGSGKIFRLHKGCGFCPSRKRGSTSL